MQNYRFLYHGDQKISGWRICRWCTGGQLRNPPVQIRRELWLHLAIDQHPVCPNLAPAWTLTSEMVLFGSKSLTLSMWIDVHVVEICASSLREFDRINWPLTSEMFTLLDMRATLVSETVSVPTFVLGGLRGSTATSDLVESRLACLATDINEILYLHLTFLIDARTSVGDTQTVAQLASILWGEGGGGSEQNTGMPVFWQMRKFTDGPLIFISPSAPGDCWCWGRAKRFTWPSKNQRIIYLSLTFIQTIIYLIFVLRKKGSKMKERIKDEEIAKGDCGPPTRQVFFFWDFVGLEPSDT